MSFFEDAQTELDEVIEGLKTDTSPAMKTRASDAVDAVHAAAEQMGGSILGDIDNTLIKKANQIQATLETS